MGEEDTAIIGTLREKLKPGQLVLFEVYSVEDAEMCHGFGAGPSPHLASTRHLGVIGERNGQTIVMEKSDNGVLISTKNNVSLNGRNEVGFFIGIEDIDKLKLIEFNGEKDFESKRFGARHEADGNSASLPVVLRGNAFVPHIISVNVYLGDSQTLCKMIQNTENIYKAYGIFAKLKLGIPEGLEEKLRTESEKAVVNLYKSLLDAEASGYRNETELSSQVKQLKDNDVTRFVTEVGPFPGVTIKVRTFLDAVEDRLAERQTSIKKTHAF